MQPHWSQNSAEIDQDMPAGQRGMRHQAAQSQAREGWPASIANAKFVGAAGYVASTAIGGPTSAVAEAEFRP